MPTVTTTYVIGNGSNGAGANQIVSETTSGVTTDYAYDGNGNRSSRTIPALTLTGNTTSGSTTISSLSSTTALAVGMGVSGPGIPSGATVGTIVSSTSITLSAAATATGASVSLTFSNTDTYTYDDENRLIELVEETGANPGTYTYAYDYRTRRVTRTEPGPVTTQSVFDGGLSIEEFTTSASSPTVEYIRGHDYGGGVGGLEYSVRSGTPSFNFYDSRGDVTTKTNASGTVTYQTGYEAFGNQTVSTGTTPLDRQRASTKEQDPTGLLNEGFRYRDPSTGTFLTRDPLGNELMMGDDYWLINGRKVYKVTSGESSATAASQQMAATKNQTKGTTPTISASVVANGDNAGNSKFYERVHVPGIAEPNLYTYVRQNPWTRFDPLGLDWIQYNGQQATWYGGKTGDTSKPEHVYKASSGFPGHQDTSQQGKVLGPIPEGKYSVNLKPNPDRVAQADSKTAELYSGEGIQRIPDHFTTDDGHTYTYGSHGTGGGWGTNRARLDPAPNTDTQGRSNFYLHDSTKGFSHGCIETGTGLFDQLRTYRAAGNKSIEVMVKYQSGTTSTYGATDKP